MLTSKIETLPIDNDSWLAVYQVNETGIIYEIDGETEEDAIHNLLTSLAIDYLASEFSDAQWYNTCQDFGSQFQAYLRSWDG